MRRFFLAFLLFTLSFYAFANQEINSGISGSWFNPEQAGHSFSPEVVDGGTLVAYWYAYDFWGEPRIEF